MDKRELSAPGFLGFAAKQFKLVSMTSAPFWIWEALKHPGTLIVFAGVVIEVFIDCSKRPKNPRFRRRLRMWGGFILVIGLSVEIPESAISWKETAAANERAALVQSNNLALSIELAKLKNPRTIYPDQRKEFVKLLKDVPKIEIKVFCPERDNEAFRYASQIRTMLNEAGYGSNNEQVIEVSANARELEGAPKFSGSGIGCFWYGTNKTTRLLPILTDSLAIEKTNSSVIFAYVMWGFETIGVRPAGGDNDFLLKQGEFGVLVPSRIH